jgi:ankyrin repeat protein
LDNLPETLDETYERTLQGINREKWDYAFRLFQCLVVSIRPLRVEELAEVLAVQPDDKNIISRFDAGWRPENANEAVFSACSTLITIVNVDGEELVQFSHFSVKEYLMSNRIATSDRVSRFHVLLRPAHVFLTRASLGILLDLGGHINKRNVKDFPLASYAAKHWVDHALFEDISSLVQDGMEFLFHEDKPHFAAWVWVHDLDKHPLQSHMPGARPEQPDAGPLYYAALCGFHVMAERLLTTRRHDVNARGGQCTTALHVSVKKGHLKVTQTLLENDAKVNARDDEDGTPLHNAAQHGDPEIVRSLLQGGADPNVKNENHETPLFLASRKGRLEAVKLLLEYGADPNHQDEWGWSALRTAAANGQDDVAELLLRYRANHDLRDADSNTPLHMASFNGRAVAVQVLLEYGSDVDARDRRGGTPLQDAAQEGFLDVVRLLLDKGADPNATKEDRWAALHVAAGNGHLEVVKLVLEHGGDPHARNGEGETPLQVALRGNHPMVVQLLKEHGGGEPEKASYDLAQAVDHDHPMVDPDPTPSSTIGKRKAPESPPAQLPPAPALRRTAQSPSRAKGGGRP